MLILATDTSGKHGSIALVRCKAESLQTLELVPLLGGTFSAELVPQIAQLLSKHSLNKNDIDAFAVVSGPGSFTGLRVGLAGVKALAEILQKPIAAVSLLEAIAFELVHAAPKQEELSAAPFPATLAGSGDHVLIALDAGRNEVFVGNYEKGDELPIRVSESLLGLDELVHNALASRQRIYTPDENIIQNLSSRGGKSCEVDLILVPRPNTASIAHLGYKKIVAGQTVSALDLDATYIRRADAEIKKPTRA